MNIPWIYTLYLNQENSFYYQKIQDKAIIEDVFLEDPIVEIIGDIKIERWIRLGNLDRGDLPSIVITYPNKIKKYIWKNIIGDNIENRDFDLPSIISTWQDGSFRKLKWLKNNIEHREGLEPSYISFFENGEIKEVRKKVGGKLCSLEDIYSLERRKRLEDNSVLIEKSWHYNDNLHRSKFPSVIRYKIRDDVVFDKEFEWYYLGCKGRVIKF